MLYLEWIRKERTIRIKAQRLQKSNVTIARSGVLKIFFISLLGEAHGEFNQRLNRWMKEYQRNYLRFESTDRRSVRGAFLADLFYLSVICSPSSSEGHSI